MQGFFLTAVTFVSDLKKKTGARMSLQLEKQSPFPFFDLTHHKKIYR